MKQALKLGCVGGGMIMNVAHVPAFVELRSEVVVAAIYSTDRDTAETTRTNYLEQMAAAGAEVNWDVVICDDFQQMLTLVDVVDICTPTRYHAYYAELALKAGVHAMSEKPIARNWLEAYQLVQVAKESGALYQLNDDNVFLPRYQHIKNILASGAIGDVTNIVLPRGSASSDRNEWFFEPVSGGGAILDYGSHAVMGAWFLLGFDKVPVEVKSIRIRVKDRTRFISGRLREIETDDDAHFKVLFQNPKNGDFITAMLEATWSWPDFGSNASDVHGFIRIDGTEGQITSHFDADDNEFIRISSYTGGERLIPIQSYRSETLSFRDEIVNFIRSIRSENESMIDAAIGAETAKIITAAQISELRGRVSVRMDEVPDFCHQFDNGSGGMLEIGDAIALELTKPYRLNQ